MQKRCLVVADDPMVRQDFRGILGNLGLEVLEAASVSRAGQCLSTELDAVIVLDSSVGGSENMIELLQHLALRGPSSQRPRTICIEGTGCVGGGTGQGADMTMRLADVASDSIATTLGILKVID